MLHHRVAGQGKPLVAIHGLFGSMENLGAVVRHLRDDYTVYSLDLPNHGRSPHKAGMHLQAMAGQVREWMAHFGIDKAHFLGHSLGGKVAMETALQTPECVDKLVVMDIAPVNYSARHNDVFAGLFAVDPARISSREEADRLMSEHVKESAVRSFLLKNLVKTDAGFEWRMNLADLHQSYPSLIEGNTSSRCDCPTLFLKGGDSDYIQETHRDDILSRFPNTQLKVIPDTGHWLHAQKPELVARLVKKFLAGE